jgi:ABC-2 type transport system ATP-binding protein
MQVKAESYLGTGDSMNIMLEEWVVRHPLHRWTLGPIDLNLEKGLIALVGHNGSGKSTMLRGLAGVLPVASGKALFYNKGGALTLREIRLRRGYMPQEIAVYEDMTLRQFLMYVAGLKSIRLNMAVDEIEGLCDFFSLVELLDQRLSCVSVGEQRKAMWVQAFLGRPHFVFLDEPFSSLDVEERKKAYKWLNTYSQNAIVIVATHLVEEIETLANQVVRLRDGRLLEPIAR